MLNKPSKEDNNLSGLNREETTEELVEMAADQLANLIWDHWMYMQEQKKKNKKG